MKQLVKCTAISLLATGVLLSGCSSDNDDDESEPTVAFDFRTDQPDAYTRVDRSGMPAIATALIASKDAYNDANPSDDIAGTFVPEILNSLTTLHGALDGQLIDLGLTPCTVVGDGTGSCAAFAVPLIIPDTVKLDTSAAAGFPNGRQLTDPVVAVTLAVALLELSGDQPPHAPDALVGVVNPTANDKEFLGRFPFLAEPFQP
jgi:hypothetical protein